MSKTKYLFVSLLFPLSALAGSDCPHLYPYGEPEGLKFNAITSCHTRYVVKFDPACKIPYFTVERLTREAFIDGRDRAGSFKPDPNFNYELQANDGDYYKSGFDRGHMVPSRNYTESAQLMEETFLYSNVVPQNPGNNRGIWKRFENYARTQSDIQGTLFIISGTILSINYSLVGPGKVCVPDMLYKIIINPVRGTSESFLVPNTREANQYSIDHYRVEQSYIESETKIRFTPLK